MVFFVPPVYYITKSIGTIALGVAKEGVKSYRIAEMYVAQTENRKLEIISKITQFSKSLDISTDLLYISHLAGQPKQQHCQMTIWHSSVIFILKK